MTSRKLSSALLLVLFGLIMFALWVLTTPNNFVLRYFRGEVRTVRVNVVAGPYPEREDFVRLRQNGITTLLSLLNEELPHEDELLAREKALAAEFNLEVVNIPMPEPYKKAEFQAQSEKAVQYVLSAPADKKFYIHCYTGSHRMVQVRDMIEQRGGTIDDPLTVPDRRSEEGKVFDRARLEYNDGKFEAAAQILTAAPKLDSAGKNLLGWCYYRMGDTAKAREVFESEKAGNPGSYNGLGYCALREKNYADAEALFNQRLANDPENVSALMGLGYVMHQTRQYEKAMDFLKKLLAVRPDYTEASDLLKKIEVSLQNAPAKGADAQLLAAAETNYAEGKYQEAIDQLLQLAAPDAPAVILLGWCRYKLKQFDDAKKQFASLSKDNRNALTGLAYTEMQLGNRAESEKLFREALAQQPDDQFALMGLGYVLFQLARHAEAKECLGKILAAQPGHAEAVALMARVEAALTPKAPDPYALALAEAEKNYLDGKYQEAVDILARQSSLDSAGANLLGWCFYKLKKYDDAKKQFASQPMEDLGALTGLAYSEMQLSNRAESEKLFRAVLAQKPDDASAHMGLGLTLYRESRFDEAEPCFKKVLELKPDDAEAAQLLEKIASFRAVKQPK